MAEMSMVEKVARAMAEADVKIYEARHPDLSRDEIAGAAAVVAGDYVAMARAAIEAMREPTREMDDVGRDHNFSRYATPAWQAMIDAALSEEVAG